MVHTDKIWKNDFKEEFTEKEITALAERIRNLTLQQIDNLYDKCGYHFVDANKVDLKAIYPEYVDQIKSGPLESSKWIIWTSFLTEVHKKEVIEVLDELESR